MLKLQFDWYITRVKKTRDDGRTAGVEVKNYALFSFSLLRNPTHTVSGFITYTSYLHNVEFTPVRT